MTFGALLDQGPAGTGTQGVGVRTPRAAAVADAVAGFIMEEQSPNGPMFVIGAISAIVAVIDPEATTFEEFVILIGAGAEPKGHDVLPDELIICGNFYLPPVSPGLSGQIQLFLCVSKIDELVRRF